MKLLIYTIIGVLTFGIVSCDDYLEQEPPSKLTPKLSLPMKIKCRQRSINYIKIYCLITEAGIMASTL